MNNSINCDSLVVYHDWDYINFKQVLTDTSTSNDKINVYHNTS